MIHVYIFVSGDARKRESIIMMIIINVTTITSTITLIISITITIIMNSITISSISASRESCRGRYARRAPGASSETINRVAPTPIGACWPPGSRWRSHGTAHHYPEYDDDDSSKFDLSQEQNNFRSCCP